VPINKKADIAPKHSVYHNTKKLLRIYRDITKSHIESMEAHQEAYIEEYGTADVSEYLELLEDAGFSFEGTKLEHHARCMKRTQEMLNYMNNAVQIVRCTHIDGERFYRLLYHKYLAPPRHEKEKPLTVAVVLERMREDGHILSISEYRTAHGKAVELLDAVLWGYTSKETINILNTFLAGEEAS